ncbi:conserved Plasmodium protein, unknown function [Plasmodium ovale]|uniref:Uncharacterized protein n=2 Tax=Plasmodium ovale TaxID=36330 RepID=A0A1A8VUJ0_PLAOA|nr:hypothetical protein, conserved [Plasmodium ovale curtisi]SBS90428.1 hypothetical protein, conserved [Plasmodium ovale curtisi]SCP04410.1 conserved Plasmodium protein, unknown function [Plasmodium ovale]
MREKKTHSQKKKKEEENTDEVCEKTNGEATSECSLSGSGATVGVYAGDLNLSPRDGREKLKRCANMYEKGGESEEATEGEKPFVGCSHDVEGGEAEEAAEGETCYEETGYVDFSPSQGITVERTSTVLPSVERPREEQREKAQKNNRMDRLRGILCDQLRKKKGILDEKLRTRAQEKSKLEDEVKKAGLELARVNKENEMLENKKKKLINSLRSLKLGKSNHIRENTELRNSYNNEMVNMKRELNYYVEIYNRLNNNLLELNNLKKYYEAISSSSKVSENVALANEGTKWREIKINKKENILIKMNYELNELKNDINIKKDMCKNEERELRNLERLIGDEKNELLILKKEKNDLGKMLNDSVHKMRKRDEAIYEINNKLEELKRNINDIEKSNEQMERESTIEREKKGKLLMEMRILKRDLNRVIQSKEGLEKDVEETKEYNKLITIEIEKEKKKLEEILDKVRNIHKDVRNREKKVKELKNEINQNIDKIIGMYTEEIKISHFSSKIKNDLACIKESITKKENEIENYKNGIIRIKIQQILENTKIENMEKKRNTINDEFNEKNDILTTYDTIIKKNHHLIENKQVEVDRLNEELDRKNKKNCDSNNHGIPVTLEIKIKKLNKNISEILNESRLLEKEWFLKQSELIKIQNENSKINEDILKGNDICLILGQKKCELEEKFVHLQDEVKKLNKNIGYTRLQLERFETKNKDTVDKISNMENDLLKWNEHVHVKNEEYKMKKENLKIDIDKLKGEKEKHQQDLLDCENKILILENKIVEKKKLQGIVKEYTENKDIIQLKKKIQLKKGIIENMKKQQNVILSNIKLALNKRNDLDNKKELFQKNYQSGINVSFKIEHEISLIKKNVKATKGKRETVNGHLCQLTKEYDNLLKQMKDQQDYYLSLNRDYLTFDGIVKILNFEKKHRFQELLKFQNAVKNLHTLDISKMSYDQVRKSCSTFKKRLSAIKNKLERFGAKNEAYSQFISVLLEWLAN